MIPLARKLPVVVVANPTHLTLGGMSLRRFGPDNMKGRQPIRSLIEANIPLAIGSDGEMNPFLVIMLISTIPGRPQDALTRQEAIIAYTATAAFAEFEESRKGTLEPGKLRTSRSYRRIFARVQRRNCPGRNPSSLLSEGRSCIGHRIEALFYAGWLPRSHAVFL
ncbi:MAG: amidohydrolase family protein [Bryobacteraceae bacterium]